MNSNYVASKGDRGDSGNVLCNLQEGRLSQVEVLTRRVAPRAEK